MLESLLQFFREDGWSGVQAEEQPLIRLRFQGDNGRWDCYAQVREEQRQITFYSACTVYAPENKRAAAAEFLTRANYGLASGNFEMDWDTGEIRFKTSLEVEGDQPSPD